MTSKDKDARLEELRLAAEEMTAEGAPAPIEELDVDATLDAAIITGREVVEDLMGRMTAKALGADLTHDRLWREAVGPPAKGKPLGLAEAEGLKESLTELIRMVDADSVTILNCEAWEEWKAKAIEAHGLELDP